MTKKSVEKVRESLKKKFGEDVIFSGNDDRLKVKAYTYRRTITRFIT